MKAPISCSTRPPGGRGPGGRGGGYRMGWRTVRVWRIGSLRRCAVSLAAASLTTNLGAQICPSNTAGLRLRGAATRNHRFGPPRRPVAKRRKQARRVFGGQPARLHRRFVLAKGPMITQLALRSRGSRTHMRRAPRAVTPSLATAKSCAPHPAERCRTNGSRRDEFSPAWVAEPPTPPPRHVASGSRQTLPHREKCRSRPPQSGRRPHPGRRCQMVRPGIGAGQAGTA